MPHTYIFVGAITPTAPPYSGAYDILSYARIFLLVVLCHNPIPYLFMRGQSLLTFKFWFMF